MVDRYAVGRMWSADTLRELSRENVRAGEIFTRDRLAVNRWAVPQPRRVSSLESCFGARGCPPSLKLRRTAEALAEAGQPIAPATRSPQSPSLRFQVPASGPNAASVGFPLQCPPSPEAPSGSSTVLAPTRS